MNRLPRMCIPRTEENVARLKYVTGTFVSIAFGVAFAVYLIMEIQTTEQLLELNYKLKTIQIDVRTKQKLVEQLRFFNEDLIKHSHDFDKNFALAREGAFVETFYGREINTIRRAGLRGALDLLKEDAKTAMGWKPTYACSLLRNDLNPHKFIQFRGDRAGVVIRLSSRIAIHTIVYDHLILDFRDGRYIQAAPKHMLFYGIKNQSRDPILLGNLTLNIDRKTHHQQAILHLHPKDFYDRVRFDIVSNHGHPGHTIAYKLSVYGTPKEEWLH